MVKVCQVIGKCLIIGNNVLYVNNKIKCRFEFNLYYYCFWVESEKCFVRLCVLVKGMCIIDKKGIDFVLIEM